MNIKDYSREVFRTLAKLDKDDTNIHMLLGLVTEVGELADIYKKELAYAKSVDLVNVQEEVGDIMWYLVNFCTNNGLDLEKILDQNVAKLLARYPEKFSVENATKRDLEKERAILESKIYTVDKWD